MSDSAQPKRHTKLVISLLIMLSMVFAFFYWSVTHHSMAASKEEVKIDGVLLNPPKIINEFKLTDMTGKPFTNENLKGQWTMMFFGFCNCGMVCPTTLSSLNKMFQLLEKQLPQDQLPRVLFVTVDSERDTLAKLKKYVTTYNSHFLGARGEPSDIAALTKQLHILAIKIQTKHDYYYDHSAEILLVNPEGKVQAYLSYPHKPEQMVKDYQTIISSTHS